MSAPATMLAGWGRTVNPVADQVPCQGRNGARPVGTTGRALLLPPHDRPRERARDGGIRYVIGGSAMRPGIETLRRGLTTFAEVDGVQPTLSALWDLLRRDVGGCGADDVVHYLLGMLWARFDIDHSLTTHFDTPAVILTRPGWVQFHLRNGWVAPDFCGQSGCAQCRPIACDGCEFIAGRHEVARINAHRSAGHLVIA